MKNEQTEKQIREIFNPSVQTPLQALKRLEKVTEASKGKILESKIINIIEKASRAIEGEVRQKEWINDIKPQPYPSMNANVLHGYFYNQYPKMFGTISPHVYFMENTQKIAAFFSKDQKQCEKYGIDLSKGLLLYGGVGVGKTSIMKCFAYILAELNRFHAVGDNPDYPSFRTVSVKDIQSNYIKEGIVSLNKYSRLINEGTLHQAGWFLDDVGTEQEANNYGNQSNVIEDILQQVYNRREMRGRVHASTNIGEEQLIERYGQRVYSRICELFTLIEFPTEAIDMRQI